MNNNISIINDNNFNTEVLKSNVPVIICFCASWCVPCKSLITNLEAVYVEYKGEIKIVKMDIEESAKTSNTYNIRSVPTLIIIKGSKVHSMHNGLISKSQLINIFNSL